MRGKLVVALLVLILSAVVLALSFQLYKILPDGLVRDLLPAAPVVNNSIIKYLMFGSFSVLWGVIILCCINPAKDLLAKNWKEFVVKFLTTLVWAVALLFISMEVLVWIFLPLKSSNLVG